MISQHAHTDIHLHTYTHSNRVHTGKHTHTYTPTHICIPQTFERTLHSRNMHTLTTHTHTPTDYIHTHSHTYTHTHTVQTYICTQHTRICTYTSHTNEHMLTTHTHTHINIYIYAYVHTYTQVYARYTHVYTSIRLSTLEYMYIQKHKLVYINKKKIYFSY